MELDDAFANTAHIPRAETYPPRWASEAEAFRKELASRADLAVPYGDSPRQVFDHFRTSGLPAGTLVFVHGGYWLRFDRSSWSHFAAGALEAGWDVIMLQYDLCPAVLIAEITRQVAAALRVIAQRVHGPLSLSGHSAGGHLVSRMLAPDILADTLKERIVRVAPISPVADLRPLLRTSMNADFGLDIVAAEAESPVLQMVPDTPVHIWVGSDERPVFVEQSEALAHAWSVPVTIVPGRHHFDIIDALKSARSDLVQFLTLNQT